MMRIYQFLPIATLLVIGSFVNACEPFSLRFPAVVFFDKEGHMFVEWDSHVFKVETENHEFECEICRSFE